MIPWAATFRRRLFGYWTTRCVGWPTPTKRHDLSWITGTPFKKKKATVIEKIKVLFGHHMPLHLIHSYLNFPAIDLNTREALFIQVVDNNVYDPDEQYLRPEVTCVQITFNSEHLLLSRVSSLIKAGSPLAHFGDLCPSNARPWRFVFIVPSDMASAFTLQVLEVHGTSREWAGKVEQYMLGLLLSSSVRTGFELFQLILRCPESVTCDWSTLRPHKNPRLAYFILSEHG